MSFRSSGPAPPSAGRPAPRLPRWPRYVIPALVLLLVLAVVVSAGAGAWTSFLWFRSLHYGSVFTITYGTRWALFFGAGIFMAAVTGTNIVLAHRLGPARHPGPPRPAADAYRMAVDAHRRLLLGVTLGLVGVVSGIAGSAAWRTWLLFANRVPFGTTDPQFHLDISFFVFTYPFIRLVLGFLFAAVLLSLVAALAVHSLYGGLVWRGRRPRATVAAQAHVFVLIGLFVLLKAVAYWFDRYGIDLSQHGTGATGASYTDVNALLPAKTVLAVIAVLCALLFFAGAARRSAMLPAVGFCLLVLSAVLLGGVYPAVVRQFVVEPSALAKERVYIAREIAGTRSAYGLTGVRVTGYPGISTEPAARLAAGVKSLPGIRLMDPAVTSQAFRQLQQVKDYYRFPGTLAVGRYVLPGAARAQDVVIAVRGMSGPPPGQSSWVNDHLVYTHGFGVVAARADSAAAGGNPAFVESGIPPRGSLGSFQPRVYYGPQAGRYVVVGGPRGSRGPELDYPSQNAAGQKNDTYTGSGGVAVGSLLRRALYAVRFHQLDILLSSAVNGRSRILYDRRPLARVARVAPFLTLDGSAYPVVAGHSILWVVDGYTTSDTYPYSARVSLSRATATSRRPGGSVAGAPGQVNYIRNSVKAVVNAYTGAVTLYEWDSSDPVLRAWMKAFPGVIKPRRDIPASLLPHLRYPTALFEVQRQILATYHITDPQSFYGGQDFWSVPADPTAARSLPQPPSYLTMRMPGYHRPEFSLTTTFVQRGRANLAGVMTVDSNPAQPGYGTIRILRLPQDTAIPGPSQVQNAFETFPRASVQLTQLRQGGSRVILGGLTTLPVGGGLLSVEPVYVAASAHGAAGSYPALREVFVYFGGRAHPVGYAATLSGALAQVFGSQPATGPAAGPGTGPVSGAVRGYLRQAQQDYTRAQAALGKGDFAAYGQDMASMKQALDAAARVSGVPVPPAPARPAPTPTPSASAGPAPAGSG